MDKEIVVSVICVTYNHEMYVRKAIESFLMQETNFEFEILIHDDASTDKTAQIIQEYVDAYPDKIKAILQTENRYSRGLSVFDLLYEIAQGRYFAICEGDDYWTEPSKLQKQVEKLEQYPECMSCCHNVSVVNQIGELMPPKYQDGFWMIDDGFANLSALKYDCKFFHTSSFMMRACLFREMSPELTQEYRRVAANDDMKWAALSLVRGNAYHIAEDMSCYRVTFTGSSWTARHKDKNFAMEIYTQLIAIKKFFLKYYGTEINYKGYYGVLLYNSMVCFLRKPNIENVIISKQLLVKEPGAIVYLFRQIIKKILKKLKELVK